MPPARAWPRQVSGVLGGFDCMIGMRLVGARPEHVVPVERFRGTATSLVDVLDCVLDRGVVLDAWMRATRSGIDLVRTNARLVVVSMDTGRNDPKTCGAPAPAPRPQGDLTAAHLRVVHENAELRRELAAARAGLARVRGRAVEG